jgi:methylenetetrahydrofolate dehydrogenase (NAD+)
MILLRNLLVCTAMATYFKSLSPSQLLALKSLESIQQEKTSTLIASEQNTSTPPPIDSMLSSSILETPDALKSKDVELLLEQTADQLQRMVQNNPDVGAKPAEAIEKKGTIEEVVAA